MTKFLEIPASNKSIGQRRSVFGVGVNNADYIVCPTVNGIILGTCPFYTVWHSMIRRCYSSVYQAKKPTYAECSVCKDWLIFLNFKKWMIEQDWEGKELDKDLLCQGNKVYEPSKCVFVTRKINLILKDNILIRGKFAQGVTFRKRSGMFEARCNVDGKRKHIGSYSNEGDAYNAYKCFKYNHIAEVAKNKPEPIKSALLAYKLDGDF